MDQQLSALPPLNPLGYLNSTQEAQVLFVRLPRDPTAQDRRYKLDTLWTNTLTDNSFIFANVTGGNAVWTQISAAGGDITQLTGNSGGAVTPTGGNVNIVGNSTATFVGAGSTLTLTQTASGFPITPFVVGPVGQAGYQTVQSAITAASADGGGLVFIQPGTYTENLTLASNVSLLGADNASVIISGVHTPPASGTCNFSKINFSSATHIFSSAVAGSTSLLVYDCFLTVTDGYVYNLANWTGNLTIDDSGSNGTNDGIVNNTGGSLVKITDSTVGAGSTHTMTTSGLVIMDGLIVNPPVSFATGSILDITEVNFASPITLANNSTGTFDFCSFIGGASAAITMSSSAAIGIAISTVSSSNNPSIAGAGAGTLTLGDITFLGSNSALAGTLTLAYNPSRLGVTTMTGNSSVTGSFTASTTLTATAGAITATNGNLVLGTAGNKILSTSVATTTTAGDNSFGSVTLAGGTATVATTAVTASSLIYIWRQSVGATGAAALGNLSVGTITASTSFVINAWSAADATALQASDVSVIGWMIVN